MCLSAVFPSVFLLILCKKQETKKTLCFLIGVYDRRLVMVVRLGPAHTCRRRDGADSTGKAFIIIDIPHSYPVTFIAAHAVTSELLMRSSPMGGVLVSGGKAAAAHSSLKRDRH